MSTPAYKASGLQHPPTHPTPPDVLPEQPNTEPSAIASPITQDVDIEGTVRQLAKEHAAPDKTELDKEYWDTFNATITEVKDLEPEQLQQVRHRMLRMIRRAKIAVNAIVKLEEGRVQVVEGKRRAKMREIEAEFQTRRRAQGDATGSEKKSKAKSEGLSQIEKQVKQFVKLNMSEAVIRTTLESLGTKIPDDLAGMIDKFKK